MRLVVRNGRYSLGTVAIQHDSHWRSLLQAIGHVAAKLTGKMDRVFFLHDNARPHVAKLTCQKIQDLGWTKLLHPPYSPDMAPTDYHLFRSLSHFLDGRQFKDDDNLKICLQTFFDQKSLDFYKQGICNLPIRWQYIVDYNGTYFVD